MMPTVSTKAIVCRPRSIQRQTRHCQILHFQNFIVVFPLAVKSERICNLSDNNPFADSAHVARHFPTSYFDCRQLSGFGNVRVARRALTTLTLAKCYQRNRRGRTGSSSRTRCGRFRLPDVTQDGAGELGEEALDKVEPGIVLGREGKLEAACRSCVARLSRVRWCRKLRGGMGLRRSNCSRGAARHGSLPGWTLPPRRRSSCLGSWKRHCRKAQFASGTSPFLQRWSS